MTTPRLCVKCESRPAANRRGPARCEFCRFDPERDGAYRGERGGRVRVTCAEPDAFGCLEVACWCGEATVALPAELVGFTTKACRRPGCREPQAAWSSSPEQEG